MSGLSAWTDLDCVSDLGINVGEVSVKSPAHHRPPPARELRHLAHRESPVPVGGWEVLGHLSVNPEVLDQSDEHGGGPGVSPLQQQTESVESITIDHWPYSQERYIDHWQAGPEFNTDHTILKFKPMI